MSSAAQQPCQRIHFSFLAGAIGVDAGGDGKIRGQWRTPYQRWIEPAPPPLTGSLVLPRRALEDLVNCSDGESAILMFTRKYGPLTCSPQMTRPYTEEERRKFPDASSDARIALSDRERSGFSFSVAEWREHQTAFRRLWEALMRKPGDGQVLISRNPWAVEEGEAFGRVAGALTYRANSLFRALWFELSQVPRKRLRKCAWQKCGRYFIPLHLNKTHCSDRCSKLAQSDSKLKWWTEKGTQRRRAAVASKRSPRLGGTRSRKRR